MSSVLHAVNYVNPWVTCHGYGYGLGMGTKILTHGKTHTHGVGMGFCGYGYGYCQKYPWVTHAEHYQSVYYKNGECTSVTEEPIMLSNNSLDLMSMDCFGPQQFSLWLG